MNGSKHSSYLAAAVLAGVPACGSAGGVFAWTGGLVAGGGPWPVRLGLLAGGLALAGGSVALLLRRAKQERRAAEQYFESLCQVDPRDLCSDGTAGDISPLPEGHPWREVADRVCQTLLEQCRRLRELEHARTAANVRCQRAAAQMEQIKAILSGLDEPILAVDDYDELLLANRAAQELFQFEIRDGEPRAVEQLVRCQKLVTLLTGSCHRKTSGPCTDEIEIRDRGGNSRWYRVTAAKLAAAGNETGSPEPDYRGAVAVLRDVGEQKVLQKRNAEFVSAVSHEMKTPLAGIKAYVELLADGDAEDEQTREEFLEVINSQADRLQRLVDNLLNLARIEAGVVNVHKQTRSLNELLEEAVRIVQPSAEAKQIELAADLSPMYLGVLADRDMLLQAAINLLSNAVKYTPEKGRVTLRSHLDNGQARVEVQDTGVGLSEEDCRRVFEKFYRVNKDKSMASGTGLGLPLAKHIVEDVHGGRLWAESAPGQGSTFIVTIPSTGKLT
jgi:two-component system phosphate regulon sensor histidine kinase PhoR